MTETFTCSVPAAPTAGATIKLFDSTAAFGAGMLRLLDVRRVIVDFVNISHGSAASGLRAYASTNGGTNWDEVDHSGTMPATVAASTATDDDIKNFKVDAYSDWKLEYTNGASQPTTWRVTVVCVCGDNNPGV
jgi:hypothetical protein